MMFYRRRLTEFGKEGVTDLSKKEPLVLVSWVIRYFVPLVCDNPAACWTSMMECKFLDKYLSSSDLAFAFLVLEHHMMKWRYLVEHQQETGNPPSAVYENRATQGLLYDDGITGEDAKRRFDELNVYFYDNFYSEAEDKKQSKVLQLGQLQTLVNKASTRDKSNIEKSIACCDENLNRAAFECEETKEDILHRVFYYLHV